MLQEIPLSLFTEPLPELLQAFAAEGLKRSKSIDCFDFVPSNPTVVYQALRTLPPGTWCEWGSGMGIQTGIAAALGFAAIGIEIDPRLAEASRRLLDDFQLPGRILHGSYWDRDISPPADYYFVYCWPGQMNAVESHFLQVAPPAAKLLICHGADDLRCKARPPQNVV